VYDGADLKRRLWLFTTGEFSDLTVICYKTSGFPERRFKLHRSILADLIDHAHPFLARSQVHSDSARSIINTLSDIFAALLRQHNQHRRISVPGRRGHASLLLPSNAGLQHPIAAG